MRSMRRFTLCSPLLVLFLLTQAVIRVAGLWVGTWESTRSAQFGALSMKLLQTGSAFSGGVLVTNALLCDAGGRAAGQITGGTLSDTTAATGKVSAGSCTLRFEGKVVWQPSGVSCTGTYAVSSGGAGSADEGRFALTTAGTSTF